MENIPQSPTSTLPSVQSESVPSDTYSLSCNHKLIPPLERAQRGHYPTAITASKSGNEVFTLPAISGVPQHLLVGVQEDYVPLDQHPRQKQVKILENYLMRAVLNLQTLERAGVPASYL